MKTFYSVIVSFLNDIQSEKLIKYVFINPWKGSRVDLCNSSSKNCAVSVKWGSGEIEVIENLWCRNDVNL